MARRRLHPCPERSRRVLREWLGGSAAAIPVRPARGGPRDVIVSIGPEPHPIYPPISGIDGGPPFHPNRVHVLTPFVERLATEGERKAGVPEPTVLNRSPAELQRRNRAWLRRMASQFRSSRPSWWRSQARHGPYTQPGVLAWPLLRYYLGPTHRTGFCPVFHKRALDHGRPTARPTSRWRTHGVSE